MTEALARGTYGTTERSGSVPVLGGRMIRVTIQRHDGAQGEKWPATRADVALDISPDGSAWRFFASVGGIPSEVAEADDPRGVPEGHAWHAEWVLGPLPEEVRFVRVRLRSSASVRTRVDVEEL